MTTDADTASQQQTMDPAPGSHTPSPGPGAPPDEPINPEVLDRVPDGADVAGELAHYEEPQSSAAVAHATAAAPATLDSAQAAADASIMTREQYRALADRLILDPRAWREYFDRCKCFASVRMYGHKSPATVAAAGLKGMSLGMSFMEAIDRIKVIHGTPVIRGPAAINHIHERCKGAKCRCIESTDTKAVWRMERPGWEPKLFTYTWEQAEKAGLTTKGDSAYKKYPARCIKWQAASEGAQEMFGDVLGGLYFQEELDANNAAGQGDAPSDTSSAADDGSAYPEPTPHTDAPAADAAPSTKTEPTDEHPKVTRVKELMVTLARKRGAVDETLEAIRKGVYNEVLAVCKITVEKGKQPTLPQLDKMIAHLEKACSA